MNCLKLFWGWPFAVLLMLLHLVTAIVPALVMRFIGLKKLADWWLYGTTELLSDFFLFACGARVSVSGKENLAKLKKFQKEGKKICLVSNHTSMLDIPIIFGTLGIRCGFVAKRELALMPYINLLALAMRCVFMDRKKLKASRQSINKGVKRIENGQTMLIFPEGTRSKTGEIGQFRYGAFRLASESNSLIVPIVIKGVRQVFEDRSKVFMKVNAFVEVCEPVVLDFNLTREVLFSCEKAIESQMRNTYALLGSKQEY